MQSPPRVCPRAAEEALAVPDGFVPSGLIDPLGKLSGRASGTKSRAEPYEPDMRAWG